MKTSAAWLNDYLDRPASPQEQADLLTRAGLPLESSEEVRLPDGTVDIRQDVELTSNRGDCLCHVGLAREVAAMSGRALKAPQASPKASGPAASTIASVRNEEPAACPLYTARIIRGVKVGPSPKWLADRLIARGDIPRNNLVDASNFVLFELGQPTHVFDLAKLKGPKIIIRKARANEPFLPIGEGASEIKLSEKDVVIADAERAVALAGVKGGALTAVSNATTDILIEAATFSPAAVRAMRTRHGIASDSSYRFERGVHPAQIAAAADRLCEIILQTGGGVLCEGVLSDGRPIPPPVQITLRCDRCRAILGVDVTDERIVAALDRLGFAPRISGGVVSCTAPAHRIDVEREIDLIEEVARMVGLDAIAIAPALSIRVAPPQPSEIARRAVNDAMTGMGFVESVTHSLVAEQAAALFMPPGMSSLRVGDERAKAEPVLRPSIIPSLLRVFAHNRDNGVKDLKLFETASTFARAASSHLETVNLATLIAPDSPESGVRELRGVIDRLVQIVLGPQASVGVEAASLPWFSTAAVARLDGQVLGTFGVLSPQTAAAFGLSETLCAAEIGLPRFYAKPPADTEAKPLPAFPGIERDVSAILDEKTTWDQVRGAVESIRPPNLEALEFVTTFRGKQIGAGRKSLTLRMRFRAQDRTLTHEEADAPTAAVVDALRSKFGAEVRH